MQEFGWEYGYYLVYALDPSGKYEIVMRSNFWELEIDVTGVREDTIFPYDATREGFPRA